ncbi:MAG TPA: RagB/SusD family nutrient uptake outer membrane protein [Chitinophagaceae bacterium]|nr:RagB/SusD family nutrient uptake outer membrane protein [Chitinophagaceae bacterium]
MKIYKNSINILFLGVALISSSSCKKLVEVPFPGDKLSKVTVFESDAVATSAMIGLYTQMIKTNTQFASIGMTLLLGLSADEIVNTTSSIIYDEFTSNQLSTGNSMLRSCFWISTYNIIFQANNLIEGLEGSASISSSVRNQLLGESKFIRAFCYFCLVNLFGDVPLVTITDYTVTASLPRATVDLVYGQVISDLKESQNLLGAAYITAGKVRPNKWAATALLARVYLYKRDWILAEQEATSVINSAVYSLVSDLNTVFLANSNEAIWQLVPVSTTFNTWEGNIFIPATGTVPTYILSSLQLNAFFVNDARKTSWTKNTTVAGNQYYYPNKYKVRTATTVTEYYTVLRYAEMYLVRVEARTNQNNISGAQSDLNKIRTRAGLPNTAANDQAGLLSAIERERQVELFCEFGHRWLDLKRTGRADAVLSALKPNWQATDALYPIPEIEIRLNPFLLQNPGY